MELVWILTLCILALLSLICFTQMIWIATALHKKPPPRNGPLADRAEKQKGVRLYSIQLNAARTKDLNSSTSADQALLASIALPRSFNVPQDCNGLLLSSNILCGKCYYLVIGRGSGADQLIADLHSGDCVYLCVGQQVFFAAYDPNCQNLVSSDMYGSSYILLLYTMDSTKNVSECKFNLVPFYGQASSDSTPNLSSLLEISSGVSNVPLQIIGYA